MHKPTPILRTLTNDRFWRKADTGLTEGEWLLSGKADIDCRIRFAPCDAGTITDLYPFDGTDDRTWRRNTLYGIYRRIITAMRREEIAQQIQGVGLLAYAKAFRRIWLETYPDEEKLVPAFYDEQMKESLSASEGRMRYERQQRSDQQSVFRTLLFSGVGLILSVGGLVKMTDKPKIEVEASPLLVGLAKLLLQYPLEVLLPLGVVVWFFMVLWPRHIKPHKWLPLKVLQALLQPLDRRVAVGVFALLAISLFAGGIYLVWGFHGFEVIWDLIRRGAAILGHWIGGLVSNTSVPGANHAILGPTHTAPVMAPPQHVPGVVGTVVGTPK